MNIFRYIILSTLCIFASAIHDQPAKMQNILWVTTDTDNGWHFSGHIGLNPDLTLQRDTEYTFMMNAPDHKMIIYEYPNNVIAQSPDNGRGHFSVNFNQIYHHDIRYKESTKSFMSGKINLTPQQQPCCEADTAQCQACKLGWNVTQYCHHFPSKTGCDQVAPYCCKALIASCLACDLGLSVHEYCSIRPDVQGCESEHHAHHHHAIESKFTLDFNYFTIGYIGSNERNTWTSTLRGEMAVIMGINKNRIHVDKLSPVDSTGILVDFSIDEGPSTELSPEQAIELLNGMILNTASTLWTSDSMSILSKVNRVKSWPLPQQEHHHDDHDHHHHHDDHDHHHDDDHDHHHDDHDHHHHDDDHHDHDYDYHYHHTHNVTNNQTINNVTQHHEHHYHSHDEDVDHDEVHTHNYQDDHDHDHYHNDDHYVNHYHYYDNDYYHYHEDKDHGHHHGYEDDEEDDDGHHHHHNDHGHHHHEDDHDHSWRHDHQDGEYSDEYASVEHTHDHEHDDNVSEIAIWIISGVGLVFIIGLVIYMLVSGKNKNYEGRQERDDYQALIA
jgi:hypothetical protein